MVDYVKLGATALRLVQGAGKTITVIQLETAPDDAAKPWRGPADQRGPVAATQDLSAVEIPLQSRIGLGGMFKKSTVPDNVTNFFLGVAEDGMPDLTNFDELISDGVTYHIEQAESLRPGPRTMLYYFLVSK